MKQPSETTKLCEMLLAISELMDRANKDILNLQEDLSNERHYVNVFGNKAEWHHEIDIKQRAISRLNKRFQTIKQQLQ